MLTTLSAYGDGVLVSHLHRRGRGIQVGDVVGFKHPIEPGYGVIKRVVGMPGDFVMRDSPGGGKGELTRMIQVSLVERGSQRGNRERGTKLTVRWWCRFRTAMSGFWVIICRHRGILGRMDRYRLRLLQGKSWRRCGRGGRENGSKIR